MLMLCGRFYGSFKAQMHANGILPCKSKMKSYLRLARDKCHCDRKVASTRRRCRANFTTRIPTDVGVHPTSLQSIFTDIGRNPMFNLEKNHGRFLFLHSFPRIHIYNFSSQCTKQNDSREISLNYEKKNHINFILVTGPSHICCG